jgi:type VI secretion system protein ImpG
LTEYFLLPEKFRFLELSGLRAAWSKYPEGFEIYLYFSDSDIELIKGVDDASFQLGCVPVVNIFEARSDPIQASKITDEVRLDVDSSLARFADVYRVKSVTATGVQGETKTIKPFYEIDFDESSDDIRWSIKRRNSSLHKGTISHGTDTYLNFVDKSYSFINPGSGWVINSQLECTNRDLPSKLPFGPQEPKMGFLNGGAGLRIDCLIPPTSPVQPKLSEVSRWQFIAQLSLQQFSDKDGLKTLKSTLSLYNLQASKEIQRLIDGIVTLDFGVSTRRIKVSGRSAICQGTKLTLTCDESFYVGNSLYLFGCVLDEFFAQYSAVNSFTQLVIKSQKNTDDKFTWEPRVGCQPLI